MSDIQTTPEDARARSIGVPPQLVEDVQSNPERLRPVARSMAAINLHNLFVRMQHPSTTNRERLEFQAMLNKMSGLDAKEAPQQIGSGFSITINIPSTPGTQGTTIEAKASATQIEDVEPEKAEESEGLEAA